MSPLIGIGARISPKAAIGVALLVIFGIALWLRIGPPYDAVFVGDWVRFSGHDPWYHMRLVENLVQHFPSRIAFDPFTIFPYGQDVFFAPFYDLLLGFVIWVVGVGSPSQRVVEVVGAYFPAVLGALTIIPVYFLGRELFGRGAGLLSAGLIAILPGEFLFRSLLGFSDHHVAEVLFSTTAILFFVLAIKSAREEETTFGHLRNRQWRNIRRPVIFGLLAGITLGVYLLSWVGGLLMVAVISVYVVVQYVSDHLRGKSTDYLCIVGVPSFLVALVMICPFTYVANQEMSVISLAVGVVVFVVASGLSWLMTRGKVRRAYYPVALAGLGVVGAAVLYAVYPGLFNVILGETTVFMPSTAARTISEVRPLFYSSGVFSLLTAWRYFTTSFLIALVSLCLLIWAMVRERSADRALIVVWSLVILAATLSQTRFAYYYAVNVALLSGYLSWAVLRRSGFSRLRTRVAKEQHEPEGKRQSKKKRKEKRRKEATKPRTSYLSARYALPVAAAIVVFFAVFYPNIGYATATAAHPAPGADEAWHSSLLWMRDETPDPFGDPSFYYEPYAQLAAGATYDYPESAYGVMSWWDSGHWITYIAHRIPNSNPTQAGASQAAWYFSGSDEGLANEILDSLGSRYVIIDYETATADFTTMLTWIGEDETRFFEVYAQIMGKGEVEPKLLFYPDYYRSMCSRLYNFGAEAVVPKDSTSVVSYVERTDTTGNVYKEISTAETFSTYEEAEAYLDSQSASNYRIVGTDPFVSPVPLEELEHYELVHDSDVEVPIAGGNTFPEVRILEYKP
jgi:oligosaccharyl transferase (archaeosortase A-associated)